MDNYFTSRNVMNACRERGMGAFGTARPSRGWPPEPIKEIDDMRFNTLYWCNDKENFTIYRWLDNNAVLFVSNVHGTDECCEVVRKRPRQTQTNRSNIQRVIGGEGTKAMVIPAIVDDYNNCMNGVDRADQLIAYYKPNLVCNQTLMPMFLHALDVIRINS